MRGNIFISYRRKATTKDARALYERLRREFGAGRVFIDLEGIEPGEDFGLVLDRQLAGSEVLVAVIGPDWLEEKDEYGRRRLDDEHDFVRMELTTAFRLRMKVFPVLVDGALAPRADRLPEDLRYLVRRQALTLDYSKFDADVLRLARAIRKSLFDEDAPHQPPGTNSGAAKHSQEDVGAPHLERNLKQPAPKPDRGVKASEEAAQLGDRALPGELLDAEALSAIAKLSPADAFVWTQTAGHPRLPVKSTASPRTRYVYIGCGEALLAALLGGWTWAYLGNRQLVANVQADLDKVVSIQHDRTDLASRLDALEVLQDRIEQLEDFRSSRPITISLGLYQGDEIEAKLRQEYFSGVNQIMLQPVAQAIEGFLGEVNQSAAKLPPMTRAPGSTATPVATAPRTQSAGLFIEASPTNVEDAYNALKTYLMLADRGHLEPGHLTDQLTRFWRGWLEANRGAMPRDQMIRSAERMITFTMANLQDPAYPLISDNLSLVDQTRENLRRVVQVTTARDRVYAEVKARALIRFPQITVAGIVSGPDHDVVTGSYAIPGTFTREAWEGFVEGAFKDASTRELQTADWVLKTEARDDLTLDGSPEQIRKALTDRYKAEYVLEWQRFMQGIAVAEFGNFETAVKRLDRLGDPVRSPINKLLQTLFDQTSWDNPSLISQRLTKGAGVVGWLKQAMLGQAPSGVERTGDVSKGEAEIPMGLIGREFAVLSRLMMARDNSETQMARYLERLSRLRTKFNQIKTQGDPGPGARALMVATFSSTDSELADALRYVDEQIMVGVTDSARATLRPLLVRPLIQAFAVLIEPTESELNRVWAAQVQAPFRATLAAKYPFDKKSKLEAGPAEIARVFGADGSVATFTNDALGPLVLRRGASIEPRTWADLRIRIRPAFRASLADWTTEDLGGNFRAYAKSPIPSFVVGP